MPEIKTFFLDQPKKLLRDRDIAVRPARKDRRDETYIGPDIYWPVIIFLIEN